MRTNTRTATRRAMTLLAPLLALAAWGCLHLETRVKLHDDGSATITERLQFSKRLLEFRGKTPAGKPIVSLLEKDAVLRRMKHMGKGIALVSHKVRDAEKGARESVTVFKIPKITDFRYASPFLGTGDYAKHNVVTCREIPMYANSWNGKRAGYLAVAFGSGSRTGKVTYKTPSPAEAQVYRHLRPVFRDMLKGLRLKFVVEGYAPVSVRRAGQRGRRARTRLAHLIDVSDQDLDRYGSSFLGNEEVMLELLQMHINGPNVRANCGGYSENLTVPLFRFYNPRVEVMFQPSQHYFDKYFKGKTLNFGRAGTRKADPRKDIYDPTKAIDTDGKKRNPKPR